MSEEVVNDSMESSEEVVNDENESNVESINEPIDISPQKDGKIIKEIIKEGKGWESPSNGDKVQVHYCGQLMDGTVFDSSRDRNEQFSFTVGAKQVIEGWDLAIKTMKRSEVAKFTISPEFAYGERGAPPKIEPNATLVFEIELFDWKLEDITKKKDSGVCKRILIEGEGYDSPNNGGTCDIQLIGKYEGRVFDQRNVTFFMGEGSEEGIVDGVEIAVRKMKKGEKCEVVVKPEYAFGPNGRSDYNIPNDYKEVVFEITLNNFEKVKETYQMDNNERVEQSILVKTKGTKYFKESKYKLAIKQYKRIIQLLGPPDDFEGELKTKSEELLLAGYLNLSMAYLKVDNYLEVIKNCDKALEIDPNNEKGLFRRGQAYYGQKEYDLALKEFNAVLKLDPNNKAAKNQLVLCNNAIKVQIQKEKSTYRNMFELFAKQDREKELKKTNAGDNWIKEKVSENKKNEDSLENQKNDDSLENVDIISSTLPDE